MIDKQLTFWVIDADRGRPRGGHGQPHQHGHAALLLPARWHAARRTRRWRGSRSRWRSPTAARPRCGAQLRRHRSGDRPSRTGRSPRPRHQPSKPSLVVPDEATDFVHRITALMMAGDGDLLPVSALPVDGTFPTGTARYEMRAIAKEIPIWDPDICIDCGKCAIVCPHATIRMKVFDARGVADAPPGSARQGVPVEGSRRPSPCDPGRSGRLHRLRRVRGRVSGQEQDGGAPQGDQHGTGPRPSRHRAAPVDYFLDDPQLGPQPPAARLGQGVPGPRTALRVLGRLCRLRRDAVHQAGHPAVRRPHRRRQRHRLLVDLRREPAHDAMEDERGRSRARLVQLALRGQRRVRPRHAAGHRHAGRPGAPSRAAGSPPRSGKTSSPRCWRPHQTEARHRRQRAPCRAAGTIAQASGQPSARSSGAHELVRSSVWIVGGDGWAYDIGSGGLDHVLASGRDVNCSCSTPRCTPTPGGQASKATPRGAVAKFAAAGRDAPRRIWVRSPWPTATCTSPRWRWAGSEIQTERALLEADAWPGPSLVIA